MASELFHTVYWPLCKIVAKKDGGQIEWESLRRQTLSEVTSWSSRKAMDVARVMRKAVRSKVCCVCIWDYALIYLPCGHGYCERDAWKNSYREGYSTLSYFRTCRACLQYAGIWLRLRPMQAGYRIFAFDGGGVFGMVSLIVLVIIVAGVPIGLDAHHYVDFSAGTSTGIPATPHTPSSTR